MSLRDSFKHWTNRLPLFGGVMLSRVSHDTDLILHLNFKDNPPDSPVALWRDQSGYAHHCRQPEEGLRPTASTDGVVFYKEPA